MSKKLVSFYITAVLVLSLLLNNSSLIAKADTDDFLMHVKDKIIITSNCKVQETQWSDAKKLGTLKKNTVVDRVAIGPYYTKIIYKKKYGWISNKYVASKIKSKRKALDWKLFCDISKTKATKYKYMVLGTRFSNYCNNYNEGKQGIWSASLDACSVMPWEYAYGLISKDFIKKNAIGRLTDPGLYIKNVIIETTSFDVNLSDAEVIKYLKSKGMFKYKAT